MKAGDQAWVVPASNPGATTDGTCRTIVPVATNQSYTMPVDLAKIDLRLAPGEHASVQIDFAPIAQSKINELSAKFDVVMGWTPGA